MDVSVEAVDNNLNPINPVPAFPISLDGGAAQTTDATGKTRFSNVIPGSHQAIQQLNAALWTQIGVTPAGGVVSVSSGTTCSAVVFRNKQIPQTPTFMITKTDGRSTASRNDVLNYTITVTNTSQVAAQNVMVTDTLPQHVTFLGASDGPSGTQVITWTIPQIPAGTSKTITLQAQVKNDTPGSTVLRNTAQILGQQQALTAEDTTIVEGAAPGQITIDLSADKDEVRPGDDLEYEVEVKNTGSASRTFTVTLSLPDEVDFKDASNDGDEDDGIVEWEVTLAAGKSKTFTAEVEVLEDEVEDGDTIEALATAEGAIDEESTDIEDDGDDDDGELEVSKSADTTEVFPGGTVEYTVTVENNTDDTLEDITVEDRISGSSYSIIDDGDADSRSGNTLKWEIDELEEGDSVTFRYRIVVDQTAYAGAVITNNVTVENDDFDDSASATVMVINTLPQTGVGSTGPTAKDTTHLRPFSGATGAPALPAVMMVIISLLGAGAGMGFGRRFLIGF